MPPSPATSAALAAVVLDAAPIIASALATFGRARISFEYSTSGVTVTGPALDRAFDALHAAFSAAGWGFSSRWADDYCLCRESVLFQPPHTLTQCGRPAAFPPR